MSKKKTKNNNSKKPVAEKAFVLSKMRIAGIVGTLVAAVVLIITGLLLDKEQKDRIREVTILKADGTSLAVIRREKESILFDCDLKYMTYVGVVWEEAKEKIGEDSLFEGRAAIYSYFDQNSFDIISGAANQVNTEVYGNCALCLADTNGCIFATYQKTKDYDDNVNYVLAGTAAGSSIKPLSVYGPAIEEGLIDWGSVFRDEPLFYLENKDGTKEPWPANAADYGGKDYTVSDAVKYSINTIAVRVLCDLGVMKSVDFLEKSFAVDLSRERELAEKEGEDSIIGNLALGSLRNGVTVKDMTGYYQAFANGGMYQPAFAIQRIVMDGKDAYVHTDSTKRVFSEETAYICNRLLKGVLSEGGTGEAANVEGLDICGKTGTSDGFRDNWFVGFTPEYVCACWCENQDGRNSMDKAQLRIFRNVMEGLTHDKSREYPVSDSVKQVKICRKTGKEAGPDCRETENGYFTMDRLPEKCEE